MITKTNEYGKTVKIINYGKKVVSYTDDEMKTVFYQPNFPGVSITNEDNAIYIQQKVSELINELVKEVMEK